MTLKLLFILACSPNLEILHCCHRYRLSQKTTLSTWMPPRVLLYPWECEPTLKTLKLLITGVPRRPEGGQSTPRTMSKKSTWGGESCDPRSRVRATGAIDAIGVFDAEEWRSWAGLSNTGSWTRRSN
ncbi:hypothetical protein B0O80DRAFT_454364 [Mortierella sp. GBAus27b]|nr:hypothetical protein B0O80DRAFT_454364 [Mortierella sp. GBAus27b]